MALLAVLLSVISCGDRGARDQTSGAAEAPVYVDVRTPAEFATGHVEGAINIPVEQMEQRYTELEQYRGQPMVVYCRTGRRSAIAIDVLKAKGFSRLENGGGFDGLVAKGVKAER